MNGSVEYTAYDDPARSNEVTLMNHSISSPGTKKLEEAVTSLRKLASSSGEKFVVLGKTLQSLYGETESLLQLSKTNLEQMRSGDASTLLEELGKVANDSVLLLRHGQESNLNLFERMGETIGVVKTLSKSVESITVIGSQLGIIGTNLAIQTSRLQSGVETFGDFASEIKSFSAYISRFAADIEQDTEDVVAILSDVEAKLSAKINHMHSFIERAESGCASALSAVQSLLRECADNIADKTKHSEDISKQVSHAIIAIQVDDITRQRIEHVIEALQEIGHEETLQKSAVLIRLQASQLREVSQNLQEAQRSIVTSFEKIGTSIKEIASNGKGGNLNQGAASSLKNLQRTFSGLLKISEDAIELRKSISDGLDRAIQASETISRHVVDVSTITQELNLKAINALLMSRQLGSTGGNLVVLAKELHTLSKDSIEFVTLVKQKIEHVAEVTTTLKNSALADSRHAETSAPLADRTAALNETISQFDRTVQGIAERAFRIQRRLLDTETEVSFLHDEADRLSNIEKALLKTAEQHCDTLEAGSVEEEAQFRALYDKYTMEQERRVHRAVEAGKSVDESGNSIDEIANDNADLGDFELF